MDKEIIPIRFQSRNDGRQTLLITNPKTGIEYTNIKGVNLSFHVNEAPTVELEFYTGETQIDIEGTIEVESLVLKSITTPIVQLHQEFKEN